MDSTATKNVWIKNQWATSRTMANEQNCRMAPVAKNAMMPRMELYDTVLKVLDVPAIARPVPMRCFTESVMDVNVTASTRINIFSAPTKTIMTGRMPLTHLIKSVE